jgi:hypothetical protein
VDQGPTEETGRAQNEKWPAFHALTETPTLAASLAAPVAVPKKAIEINRHRPC